MKNKLIKREPYSSILESFKDDGRIKVISGLRRSGKSSLLILFINDLLNEGIEQDQIVHLILKFTSMESGVATIFMIILN